MLQVFCCTASFTELREVSSWQTCTIQPNRQVQMLQVNITAGCHVQHWSWCHRGFQAIHLGAISACSSSFKIVACFSACDIDWEIKFPTCILMKFGFVKGKICNFVYIFVHTTISLLWPLWCIYTMSTKVEQKCLLLIYCKVTQWMRAWDGVKIRWQWGFTTNRAVVEAEVGWLWSRGPSQTWDSWTEQVGLEASIQDEMQTWRPEKIQLK